MICITVSVQYDNLLDIILPQNYKFFTKWYIVTEAGDEKTLEVIRKHGYDNVEVLFFDFRKESTFNKGGGVQFALDHVEENETVLLLDSDIFLEDVFGHFVHYEYEDDVLYSFKRYDYYTYAHFKSDIVDNLYPINFMGFFQLFKYKKNYRYQDSDNCRECDHYFSLQFPTKILFGAKLLKHLGRDGVNHFGRKNQDDFLIHESV